MILQVSCPCLDHLQSVPKLQHRKQKAMVAQRVRVAQLGGNDAHVDETYCRCSEYRLTLTWMFPKIGGKPPKWMVKIMENPIKMDDLGGPPLFLETPIWVSFRIFSNRYHYITILRVIHHRDKGAKPTINVNVGKLSKTPTLTTNLIIH